MIAFQTRITPEDVANLIEEQVALGLVEKSAKSYVIHDWKHWQGKGKSDAQRKKEQRDRDRDVSRDIPRDSHNGNSVTNDVVVTDSVTEESRVARAQRFSLSVFIFFFSGRGCRGKPTERSAEPGRGYRSAMARAERGELGQRSLPDV